MSDDKLNLGRRGAMKLIATTAVAVPVLGCSTNTGEKIAETTAPKTDEKIARSLTDPDLNNPSIHWDFVLDENELKTLSSLCDVIIPADDVSPGAGMLDAQHYINEWVSAPYSSNKKDLVTVRGGVAWLNGESNRRFKQHFSDLSEKQKHNICDDIHWEETAKPEFLAGARFFSTVRNLAATAFYTTLEGMADIGYVGNKPSVTFDGPPPAVLKQLGLDDLV